MRRLLAVSFVAAFLLFAVPAWAQVYSGSLTGVVSDPSSAAIPAASVTLTDVNKGFVFNAKTDDEGRYYLRALPPSTYKLSVEMAGFAPYVRDGIVLDVNQNATLDLTLQVGTTQQAVEVVGAAPLLSTQDASMGQVLTRTFVNDLPLLGRQVMDLAFLAPGITLPAGMVKRGESNNFVSDGGRNAVADVLVDGTSTTLDEPNSGSRLGQLNPNVDSVQEFKVLQGNFSAEVGFSGSTVVNVITRSGTNEFHGSAFEFLRNDKLNANNWFNNANKVKLQPERRNVFGFTVGGPVRKDKTFFFFDYEGQRQRNMGTGRTGVPSAAMREGDFGEICAQSGGTFSSSGRCSVAKGQIWDPFSGVYDAAAGGAVRQQFIPFNNLATYMSPGNPNLNGTGYQLPARPGNLIDPVAKKMMAYYPLPNIGVGTPGYDRFNNWIGSGISQSNNNQLDLKVDHRFSDSDLLSAKIMIGRGDSHTINYFQNMGDPNTFGPQAQKRNLATINHTHTFSPTTLLSLTMGAFYYSRYELGVQGDFPGFDPVKDLGMPEYIRRSGRYTTPTIVVNDYGALGGNSSVGAQGWAEEHWDAVTYHFNGALSRMQGRHELKIGGESRLRRLNYILVGKPAGNFSFSFNQTSQMPTTGGGDAMASFLIGYGGSGEYEVPVPVAGQNWQHGIYFQDNWRVSDRLTLNLGIRWEVDTPRTERYNRMSWFDPYAPSTMQVPGLNLIGGLRFADGSTRTVFDTDTNNWGPRFGLAYKLFPRTVVRTGYGIYYAATKASTAGNGGGGFDGFNQLTPWITTYQADGATPWGRLSDPWPITGPKLAPGSSLGMMTNVGFAVRGPIRYWNATPYEQSWSFGIQQEAPGNILVDASYVGKKGTRLYFLNGGGLNHFGPDALNWSEAQITAVNQFVTNPFYGIITDLGSSLKNPTVRQSQLLLPYPQFTSVSAVDPPEANSIYHAFQLRVEKRFSRGLEFLATYTFSKSIDDSSTTVSYLSSGGQLQDPNRRFLERSVSGFDIPQVFQFSYVYQLPWGRGRTWGSDWNPVLNGILGGWQTNGIWRFDNGQPILLSLSGGQSIPTYGGQRPNLTGRLKRNEGPDWMNQYFANPEVAVRPPRYTLGNAPRTLPYVRVPGTNTSSLSLFKEFSLAKAREGMRLQYRLEAFNALNHPQFRGPNTTVNTSNFGKVTGQANAPRQVQMALKLYW